MQRPVVPRRPYGRMSFAKRAMQLETALRSPALAMQLSNAVKTLVLRATNVPKRTANTTATTSARAPHTIPAMACPWFVAPLAPSAGDGNAAEDDRDQACEQAKREQDKGHSGHEAGHAEDQGCYAQAVARPG